jgi:hypothetical protein
LGRALVFTSLFRLSFNDCTSGASASASAAANASVSVNLVDVAFGDSSDGALVDAGTASNADVSDFVSHFYLFLGLNCFAKVQLFSDIESFFYQEGIATVFNA